MHFEFNFWSQGFQRLHQTNSRNIILLVFNLLQLFRTNAATLFCCVAPEMFFGLRHFTWIPHVWVNLSFNLHVKLEWLCRDFLCHEIKFKFPKPKCFDQIWVQAALCFCSVLWSAALNYFGENKYEKQRKKRIGANKFINISLLSRQNQTRHRH